MRAAIALDNIAQGKFLSLTDRKFVCTCAADMLREIAHAYVAQTAAIDHACHQISEMQIKLTEAQTPWWRKFWAAFVAVFGREQQA